MSNFPMFNVNMLPTPQLEQVLEALIDSAEINHWPANTDTLHWLASYRRGDDGQVYCGLYADVLEPGRVAVGDTVEPAGVAA